MWPQSHRFQTPVDSNITEGSAAKVDTKQAELGTMWADTKAGRDFLKTC